MFDNKSLVIVPYEKMDELIQKLDKIDKNVANLLQQNNSLLGDFITEKDAKVILSKGTTWFWNKRKSGELKGKHVGNTWYYKKADIIKLIERGSTN